MIEKYAPYPIEYDETRKCWKVKLKSREIVCGSERDAQLISNIPCLYEKLELNDNSSQHDYYFINSLRQTVEIMNNYSIANLKNNYPIANLNWMTRKIKARYEKISQKNRSW